MSRGLTTRRRARGIVLVAAGVATSVSAGCQDGIVDVGTVAQDQLDDPATFPGLVNGMDRTLSQALGWFQQTGLVVAREMTHGGFQGDFGATLAQADGELDPVENDGHWNRGHQARWTAEDGVRRMRGVLGEDAFGASPLAARALLDVGFANRMLGENVCVAVIDGGQAQPRSVHFERAEEAFDEALEIATRLGDDDMVQAARAGRASVLAALGRWEEARVAAEGVEPGFAWTARFHNVGVDQFNRVAGGTDPLFRAHTAWGSFYEAYFEETGDPRVAWGTDEAFPTTVEGNLPWLFQAKYPERNSAVELASWEEMRLIVAEAELRANDVGGAMAELDALRDAAGVPRWEVDGLEEAWTALKRERGIELWLEARRLWDLHRWLEDGTPGETDDMTGRDTCFPIGATEQGSNPNLG